MRRFRPARLLLLLAGCVVLGLGVGLLLIADLGSDGYSTLVNGIARSGDWEFVVVNIAVSAVFLAVAAGRGVLPGIGTLVQIVVVGYTVTLMLDHLDTPDSDVTRALLLVVAIPVLSIGIAAYLGSQLGAGPVEAAALAWDPPVPFRWSYSALQAVGAIAGWLLGAAIGPGTIVVIFMLGPLVDRTARLMRLDVHQTR
ncbi:hypothetical protein [Nocardioides marmorisolisilvae]|uniref:Membrane protein YczE n=1 Tax=Nocardioides marmorisolisilvae TaxID=1542737 RepID=A0A3N0DZG9_9ACTN|nr:hypothetical protein [Nocardioides marmorisolisilvae]RNL80999.1 hypothetical protein EFL95_01035 [Nocardioides marmorisolisilvae]